MKKMEIKKQFLLICLFVSVFSLKALAGAQKERDVFKYVIDRADIEMDTTDMTLRDIEEGDFEIKFRFFGRSIKRISGSIVKFNEDLEYLGRDYYGINKLKVESPVFFENKHCAVHGREGREEIKKDQWYYIFDIKLTTSNIFSDLVIMLSPAHEEGSGSIFIQCDDEELEPSTSISYVENLLGNIVTIRP